MNSLSPIPLSRLQGVSHDDGACITTWFRRGSRSGCARVSLTEGQVDAFRDFLDRVDRDLLHHRIITDNAYTRWFRDGQATDAELVHFVRQFSVFSNQFLVAALLRVINAPSLQQARAAQGDPDERAGGDLPADRRRASCTAGSSTRRPRTARATPTWSAPRARSMAASSGSGPRISNGCWPSAKRFGLGFDDLGKRRNGRPYTLRFCDELQRLYGSEDDQIAEGASFAVENWAAAGFWQELEDGLLHIKATRLPRLKVAFFTWHNRVEAQHAGHTMEELEEVFFDPGSTRRGSSRARARCSTPSPVSGTAWKTTGSSTSPASGR